MKDRNGNNVYCGDLVINVKSKNKYRAYLNPYNKQRFYLQPICKRKDRFKLSSITFGLHNNNMFEKISKKN